MGTREAGRSDPKLQLPSRPVLHACTQAAASAPFPLLTALQQSDVAPSWHGVRRCTLRGMERAKGQGPGASGFHSRWVRTHEEVSKGISSRGARCGHLTEAPLDTSLHRILAYAVVGRVALRV